MKPVVAALSFVLAATVGAAPSLAQQEGGPLFSSYPSFHAKFDIGSEKFSLISNVVVYNISGKTVTDVSFKQTYPDGVAVKETYQRDVGSEATGEISSARKVEGNVFYASIATWKHRQYVVIPDELTLGRRLNQITFPGLEISYTDAAGQRQTAKLQDSTYDLFKYSNVVGDLERFLKKYNNIDLDFAKATPNRKEWEFGPMVASATGRFPTGISGTNPGEDQYSGYFRILSGPPGDNLQLLVVYKKATKKEQVADQASFLKDLREYLRWCGEFEIDSDNQKTEQTKWKKYSDAWHLAGQWKDTIKSRLGGGPVEAYAFYGPHEGVQYYLIGLGQGRPLGEGSATPNPDKEAALAKEIQALFDTFRSDIVPLSIDRHH